jgi:hypothetical protein
MRIELCVLQKGHPISWLKDVHVAMASYTWSRVSWCWSNNSLLLEFGTSHMLSVSMGFVLFFMRCFVGE